MRAIAKMAAAALLAASMAACAAKPPAKIPVSEPAKQETPAQAPIQGFKLTPKAVKDGKNLRIDVELENTANAELPLQYADKKLLYVYAKDKSGKIVFEQTFEESVRARLLPKEKLSWSAVWQSKTAFYEATVGAKLLVADSAQGAYKKEELEASQKFAFGSEAVYDYLPKEPAVYTYQSPSEAADIVESFQYFDEGAAQSGSSQDGLKGYFIDKTGLYALDAGGQPATGENQIESLRGADKKLLLKLPAAKGATWQADGATYQITSVSAEAFTPYATFTGAVEVKVSLGTKVTYYYYDKEKGLVQIKTPLGSTGEALTWSLAGIQTPAQHEAEKKRTGFLPAEPATYLYANPETGASFAESFQFFDAGFAQSVDGNNIAKNVYYADAKGLYAVEKAKGDEQKGAANVLTASQKGAKTLLLKLPAVKGASWKDAASGTEYQIVSVSETVRTPFKLFDDVTVVSEEKDGFYRFSYYRKDVGLLQVKKGSDSNWNSEANRVDFVLYEIKR